MIYIERSKIRRGQHVSNYQSLCAAVNANLPELATIDLPCVIYTTEKDLIDDLFPRSHRPSKPRLGRAEVRLIRDRIRECKELDTRGNERWLDSTFYPHEHFYGAILEASLTVADVKRAKIDATLQTVIAGVNVTYEEWYKEWMKKWRQEREATRKEISAFRKKHHPALDTLRKSGFITVSAYERSRDTSPYSVH